MSEQELRDLLHAEVDSVEAPGNLAALVEKGARRRRRNQGAGAGAALAVLAVVGGVVVALSRPTPAPVLATPAHVEEGCVELPAPAAALPAPESTDMSGWRYRGDPALKAKTLALAPPELRATAVPLLGFRTVTETAPNTWVYALALRQASGWHVRIGAAEEHAGQVLPLDAALLPLPAPTAGATVSAFVGLAGGFFAGSDGGALVALGARGTERIDYLGCRDGRTIDTGASGDTLVLTTGPLEEAGRLTVQAGGRVVSAARPQDVSMLPLTSPGSTDLSGHGDMLANTQLQLVAGDRIRKVTLALPPSTVGRVYSSQVVVLGVCSGRGSVRFDGIALPCDGRTHELAKGLLDTRGRTFEVTAAPDPSTGRTSVSVALTVVAS
jgi:hypothetical protein